jgi:hypothetical protein
VSLRQFNFNNKSFGKPVELKFHSIAVKQQLRKKKNSKSSLSNRIQAVKSVGKRWGGRILL